jgi:serine/threonine protein kinase
MSIYVQQFYREALVWQGLDHPSVLPLFGIDRETFQGSLCMVSPWMENGTVLKYLNDHGRADVDKLVGPRNNLITISLHSGGSAF